MPKRPRRNEDEVQAAFGIVQQATGQTPKAKRKNPAAVALGKLGGSKGGKTRANNLSPERRSEIAHQAAEKRWGKKPS